MKQPLRSAALALALALAAPLLVPAASPLPTASPRAEHFDPARLQQVNTLVQGEIDAGHHAGAIVLIARHGRIVEWRAFGKRDLDTGAPMEKDTIIRLYSMTKLVTGVAALQLFEQNRFNLDSPIGEWLPELKHLQVLTGGTADAPELVPAKQPITVRMLLNHTAGFTYDFFSGSPVHELYRRADLWNSTSLDDFLARMGRLPLLAQPGVAHNYSVSDDVLGALIQRVSGLPLEEYVAHNITGPLRMTDTSFDVPESKRGRLAKLHELRDGRLQTTPEILGAYAEAGRGIPCGGAGLFSTAGDYARFAQCLLNGGKLDGVRILGRKTLELGRLHSLPSTGAGPLPADGWGLFSGLRINPARSGDPLSEGTILASGAATTHCFIDPREEVVALVFCQHLPYDQHNLFVRFRTAVCQALE
jgi:CubicO group peptidase (beta-lactamase class C family)